MTKKEEIKKGYDENGRADRTTIIGEDLRVASRVYISILCELLHAHRRKDVNIDTRKKIREELQTANDFQAVIQEISAPQLCRIDSVTPEIAQKLRDWVAGRPRVKARVAHPPHIKPPQTVERRNPSAYKTVSVKKFRPDVVEGAAAGEGITEIRGYKIRAISRGEFLIAPDLKISTNAFNAILLHYLEGKRVDQLPAHEKRKFRRDCGITTADQFHTLIKNASRDQLQEIYGISYQAARAMYDWAQAHDFIQPKKDPVEVERAKKRDQNKIDRYVAANMGLRDKLMESILSGMAQNPSFFLMFADPTQHHAAVARAASIADKTIHERMEHHVVTNGDNDAEEEGLGPVTLTHEVTSHE